MQTIIRFDSKTDSEPKFISKGKVEASLTFEPFQVHSYNGIYYLIEVTSNFKVMQYDKAYPLIYTYNPLNGNITMGNGSLWARREIRSNSKAFHKNNLNKMAIPNDFEKAKEIILEHYNQYKPQENPHHC